MIRQLEQDCQYRAARTTAITGQLAQDMVVRTDGMDMTGDRRDGDKIPRTGQKQRTARIG